MKRTSLRIRTFTAALLALLFFIPLMNYALQQAHNASITEAAKQRLRLLSLTLITEFEIENKLVYMPEKMVQGEFNLPDSGIYGVIHNLDLVVWQSLSTMNWRVPEFNDFPAAGVTQFQIVEDMEKRYFQYSYTARFETDIGFTPVTFHVFMDTRSLEQEIREFESTLLKWLAVITTLLLLLLMFTLNTALNPINRLIREIDQIEAGQRSRIEQYYPQELENLKHRLNLLLDTEQQQRLRYKNSLGDLAHSLKTPLAVLSGIPSLPDEGKEPVQQIGMIINRQLKRAVAASGSGLSQQEPIKPIIDKLTNAMEKVYQDKYLDIEYDFDEQIVFNGDITDLMELLGNLMDNACKAAQKRVLISAQTTDLYLEIAVSDDGPGIPNDKRELLLQRGKRLDSYESGQGIGMALVADLVAAYQGQLLIGESEFSGAWVAVRFPLPGT